MTANTSVLGIFPFLDAEGDPKQTEGEKKQKHAHEPNEQPVTIYLIGFRPFITSYAKRVTLYHFCLLNYYHSWVHYGWMVGR